MSKLLVGMVVLVLAVGVSACGDNDKTKTKTPVAQTADVHKTADVKSTVVNDVPALAPSEPAALERVPAPRFTLVLEGKSGFKFRSAMLSDDAKAKIDEMFTGDKVDLNHAQ